MLASRGRSFGAAVLTALILATFGCRGAAASLGRTPEEARAEADALLGAVQARFGPVERDRAFAEVRPKLARAALVPSRLFGDPHAWTGQHGAVRSMEFQGDPSPQRYVMALRRGAPLPSRPGEYRGLLRLQALRPGSEYEWVMRDELAVGSVSPEGLSRTLSHIMRSAQAPETNASTLIREELPRTTAALGRLFSLQALDLQPSPSGGTLVTVTVALDPYAEKSAFPRYGKYLKKYLAPLRLHATAIDETGATWWELRARDAQATLRLRIDGGDLMALAPRLTRPAARAGSRPAPAARPDEAPARGREDEGVTPSRIPEGLRVRGDFSMKMGLVRVGFKGLDVGVHLVREPHEKAFVARFTREPDWELPLFVEPLLRAPLRRPFEGEGAFLGFAVHGRPGAQTLLARDYRLAVKESWIVRWLGGLTHGALSEFRRGAEDEADRFVGEALAALRSDILALLPPAPREASVRDQPEAFNRLRTTTSEWRVR